MLAGLVPVGILGAFLCKIIWKWREKQAASRARSSKRRMKRQRKEAKKKAATQKLLRELPKLQKEHLAVQTMVQSLKRREVVLTHEQSELRKRMQRFLAHSKLYNGVMVVAVIVRFVGHL